MSYLVVFWTLALLSNSPTSDAASLTIGPLQEDVRSVLLEVTLPKGPAGKVAALTDAKSKRPVPCQVLGGREAESIQVVWSADALAKGTTREWILSWSDAKAAIVPEGPEESVELERQDQGVEVRLDKALFTRYVYGKEEYKPYLYPIIVGGMALTRHFPMKEGVPGEESDHRHHRSFWFSHGDVNGVDFWAEREGSGRIVHKEIDSLESGPVCGQLRTRSEWVDPQGKKLLDDHREYRFFGFKSGARLVDTRITLRAAQEKVVFGDTKEGTFGIRVAGPLKERSGGKAVSSRGVVGAGNAWGKPAEWMDYVGELDGETFGVAILDHPASFRHPTHWHVRDYGLFAPNPFGYKQFYRDASKDGSYELKKGESIEFRHRVVFHRGDTDEANIEQIYRGFAHPPKVKVVRKKE